MYLYLAVQIKCTYLCAVIDSESVFETKMKTAVRKGNKYKKELW